MTAWLQNLIAGLYVALLLAIGKEPVGILLWALGLCLLTFLFYKTRKP